MKKVGQPAIFPPSRSVEILAVHVKPCKKYSEKATSPKKEEKHVWLSGRLHIEGRLNEGPRLQRKHKDENVVLYCGEFVHCIVYTVCCMFLSPTRREELPHGGSLPGLCTYYLQPWRSTAHSLRSFRTCTTIHKCIWKAATCHANSCCCFRCCFSHSAHWLPARKKLLYMVANPARGLLNREKKGKEKVWQSPPPPCALLVRRK